MFGWQRSADEARPLQQLFDSPDYGVHLSAYDNPYYMWLAMDDAMNMEFRWVKQQIPWREIELEKGEYDWFRLHSYPEHESQHVGVIGSAANRNLKLILRLDTLPYWAMSAPGSDRPFKDAQDYGDFCHTLAARYKGQVGAYQVWNEPNLDREWEGYLPDPAAYTDLLKACYTGVKTADPDAIVISAGLAPTCSGLENGAMNDMQFLQGMYDAGAADYFDVLGLNAPGYNEPPETGYTGDYTDDPADCMAYTARFRHVEDMRDLMIENGDAHKQVAILEMGWPSYESPYPDVQFSDLATYESYGWFAQSEETQADYLQRAYAYAYENWTPWIGVMTTIFIGDHYWQPADDEQWWWSITYSDGTKRLAWYTLTEMDKPTIPVPTPE